MIDTAELEARVRAYAASRVPAIADARAVIAVSGGGDSIATAALLCEAGVVRAGASVVAHFDHRLRDAGAAARDLAAVEAMCARYGLRLVTGAWDAPRPGEAAAREARYRFLATVARDAGIGVVAPGHTSDDQVETVVMHALRGAGLRGLRGMAADAPWPVVESSQFTVHSSLVAAGEDAPPLRVARPMLCVSRAETRGYCDARGLAHADDATNDDLSLMRNRVRLDVLPRMEAAAPDARAALLRVANNARASVAAFDAIAAEAIAEADDDGDVVTMPRAALRALPADVAPYAWRLVIERMLGDAREFDRRHYALMARAREAVTGSTFELPRGVRITVDADAIVVSIGAPGAAAIDAAWQRDVPFAGVAGGWSISVVAVAAGEIASRRDGGRDVGATRGLEGPRYEAGAGVASGLSRASIVLPVGAVVRGRRPGDRLQSRGMRGHKKLQDYYVDRKVPRRERDAAPVIACGSDVLWTPFGACAPVTSGHVHALRSERVSVNNVRT